VRPATNKNGIPFLETPRPRKKKGKRRPQASGAAEGGVPESALPRDNGKGPGPSTHSHRATRRINCERLDPCACMVNQHRRLSLCESCDSRFLWRATA
jgi:hypothetical protein